MEKVLVLELGGVGILVQYDANLVDNLLSADVVSLSDGNVVYNEEIKPAWPA